MNDIVFTGIGVISSLGIDREAFWANLKEAKTGIKRITSFNTSHMETNIAAWIADFDPRQFMSPRIYRRMSRIARMTVAASVEALKDSDLNPETMDRERIAVIVGTAYGSISHVEDFYMSLLENGARGAQPLLFPETVPNALASHIAMFHRITGPNATFSQNEVSAENAILYARNLLLQDLVDVVVVGGADELSPGMFMCYDALGALNRIKAETDQPVEPEPGGGLVLGEGAGVLVMERRDFAVKRGARIYGTLRSGILTGGVTSTGHYEVEGGQMGRAMSLAMEQALIAPDKIDQIHVSANFSGELDRMEYDQIEKAFRTRRTGLKVTPLKYLMGDFGGAGTTRAAAILLSLHYQLPLPTVDAEMLKARPQHSLDWEICPEGKLQFALMTTSTFGGGSSSLIFARN